MKAAGIACMLLVAMGAGCASTSVYHRFWRGYKTDSRDAAAFAGALTREFVPATVKTGATRGLLAYQPVMTLSMWKDSPDEVALVTYRSEPDYKELVKSAAGAQYQKLHWDYFDRTRSHSVVAVPYSGHVEIEGAYDLHPGFSDWKKGLTELLVYFRKVDESDKNYLSRVRESLDRVHSTDARKGVRGRVCLIAEKYRIEYVSGPGDASPEDEAPDIRLQIGKEPADNARLTPGSGLNVQF